MSVFAGLFIWKEGLSTTVIAIVETNNSSVSVFSTASYILALTNSSQTEIDTLSALKTKKVLYETFFATNSKGFRSIRLDLKHLKKHLQRMKLELPTFLMNLCIISNDFERA